MENLKKILVLSFIICIILIPELGHCQGIWGAWDKSASSVDHNAIEKAVRDALNSARREEQKETEHRNHLRNASNVLSYIDESEYRSMILYESEFTERLKSELSCSHSILDYYKNDEGIRKLIMEDPTLMENVKNAMQSQKERILDFARDPHLNQLIMSDPSLREYYKKKQAKQDIKCNPRKVLEDIRDPKLRQIIEEDPELVRILAQEIEKKAQEDRELQELLDADEKAEQNRKKREREKETTRIVDENNRASEQTKKNKIEQTKNKNLQDELKSSPIFVQLPDVSSLNTTIQDPDALKVKPIDIFGINYTDDRSEKGKDNPKGNNQKTQENYYDENPEKKPYLKEKVDNVKDWLDAKDYPYKANKAFEASKETYSTLIKEAPDNARKKVISIPKDNMIDKLKEWGRNIINIAYPGANLEEKAEIVIEVEKNEKGFIEGIISDIIDAVSTGDLQKFEENTNARTKKFDDKNRSLANRYFKAWGK